MKGHKAVPEAVLTFIKSSLKRVKLEMKTNLKCIKLKIKFCFQLKMQYLRGLKYVKLKAKISLILQT